MSGPSNRTQQASTRHSTKPTPGNAWLRATAHKRAPINSVESFAEAHRKADKQLRAYIERGRKGSPSLSADALAELDPSHAMYLPANNLNARLEFGPMVARHLVAACGVLPDDQPIFFVTLIVRQHTVREDEAANLDIKSLQAQCRHILSGCDFVGMTEGAFFSNLNAAGASFKRAVSYHAHAIVWGVSRAELDRLCKAANARYKTIIDGIDAAHFRELDRDGEVAAKALYMCKGQLSEYRVWPRKGQRIDRETGEITIEGTGRFSQGKRAIRPGDMTRMYNIFARRYLDQLAFAGRAGTDVLRDVRCEALKEFRASEKRLASERARKSGTR